MQKEMLFLGQVPAVWDLEVKENLLHTQLRWLQKLLPKQRWFMA